MLDKIIYLDYAATTPVADEVIASMLPYLGKGGLFANTESNHILGNKARAAIEQARNILLESIQGRCHTLIWTSGASEANNLAIKGLLHPKSGKIIKHVITCKTEHKSVIEPIRRLEQEGYKVTFLNPQTNGRVDLEQLKQILQSNSCPALVSIMMVNNETGIVQDMEAIFKLTKEYQSYLHCDAAQAFGKISIDLQQTPIDLVSVSGHKIYAPKGIGGLFIHNELIPFFSAQIQGGNQEHGLRAGTIATHQVMAFSKACELVHHHLADDQLKLQRLSNLFLEHIKNLDAVTLNGDIQYQVPGIINISFDCVNSRTLQKMVADKLAISLGSACNSESLEPSYVLRAMGLANDVTTTAIRFSFGRNTTEQEILSAIEILSDAVKAIRQQSKIWNIKYAQLT